MTEFHIEKTYTEQECKELCLKAYTTAYHKGWNDKANEVTNKLFDDFFGWCADNKLFNLVWKKGQVETNKPFKKV
jgi:hypothetical protein